jgi:hypothetical protein
MKLCVVFGIVGCAALAAAQGDPPMVPHAGPGVFTMKPSGPGTFKLVVTGNEDRGKSETAVPVPARDPEGPRYSFRMKYFRPVWRYKTNGSPKWTRWSPFSGAPFISADPKTIGDFEVTAEIVVHKGPTDDADPLAFEAWALSDLLVNQVSPPK